MLSSRWTTWCLVALFWTLDGLALALDAFTATTNGEHRFVTELVSCLFWIPHTIMALELTARFPIERGPKMVRAIAIHVGAIAITVLTRPLLFVATDPWFDWPIAPDLQRLLLNSVRHNLFLYVLIVGGAHAMHFALRARERERHAERLEAQLTAARLSMLRNQLRPHFLFNALGAIAELVHRDPAAADRMIVRLSRLLRLALDENEPHVVTLAHELECLEPYLELEKMRYGDRLSVQLDIDPAARDARVPGLLLQPVVENAIRHGIAPRSEPGTVTIRARLSPPGVELEVEDNGVGFSDAPAFGVGLSNTRARLHEHYGTAAALEIAGGPAGGARVRISVPQEHAR